MNQQFRPYIHPLSQNSGDKPMDASVVFEKTPKGEDALRHRDESLPSDLRMVLLIINGMRNVETIQLISDPCKTSIAPLIFLEDNGYIQKIGTRDNIFPLRGNAAMSGAPSMAPANDSTPVYAQTAYAPPASYPPPAPYSPPVAYAPPAAAPMQTVAPQMQAQALYAQQQADAELRTRLSELKSYLIQTLGQDANSVLGRVAEVRNAQEYADIVSKLYKLIGNYSGVRDAERFMQRFELPHAG
jgi:hypothetical protein